MLSRLAVQTRPMVGRHAVRNFKATAQRRALIEADSTSTIKTYHYSSLASLALVPAALVAAPAGMSFPIDVILGVVLPVHSHIGMNYVLRDYAPKLLGKGALGPVRIAWLGFTAATFIGLNVLNFTGDGITNTVLALWKKPEKKD